MILRSSNFQDAQAMCALHDECFGVEAWTPAQIEGSLSLPTTLSCAMYDGGTLVSFFLAQLAGGEAELLTLCTAPAYQRQGIGRVMLCALVQQCGGERIFLEVAADNIAAITLYEAFGFTRFSVRKAYYDRGGIKVDALLYNYTDRT